jgi:hypothetical protein
MSLKVLQDEHAKGDQGREEEVTNHEKVSFYVSTVYLGWVS